MCEAKFTKGEWVVFIDDSGGPHSGYPISIDVDCTDKTVVRQGGFYPYKWCDGISNRESVANAHLIAAAPEMYEFIETYMGGHPEAEQLLVRARGEHA